MVFLYHRYNFFERDVKLIITNAITSTRVLRKIYRVYTIISGGHVSSRISRLIPEIFSRIFQIKIEYIYIKIDFILYFYSNYFRVKRIWFDETWHEEIFPKFSRDKNFHPISRFCIGRKDVKFLWHLISILYFHAFNICLKYHIFRKKIFNNYIIQT